MINRLSTREIMPPLFQTRCANIALGLLVACGGASNTQSPPNPSGQVTPPIGQAPTPPSVGNTPLTIKEQIKALEDSGKLPKLDRSSSIAGPDINKNGIRDDIDAWIGALPITDAQKKAAEQAARVRQAELLVDLNDKAEHDRLGVMASRSIKCLRVVFMPDYQRGYDLSSQIEAITANTKERAKQYIAFNRAVSGTVESSVAGNTCDS